MLKTFNDNTRHDLLNNIMEDHYFNFGVKYAQSTHDTKVLITKDAYDVLTSDDPYHIIAKEGIGYFSGIPLILADHLICLGLDFQVILFIKNTDKISSFQTGVKL